MATSGTIAYTMTARELITFSLKKLGVVSADEPVTAVDMDYCLIELNVMLKGWQLGGPNLWRKSRGSLALTANTASFLLPLAVNVTSCRLRQNGRDLPMEVLTGDEYDELPLKASTGTPTQYYFDQQNVDGVLYIWPLLASVTTETIEYTYQRHFQDVATLDENLDVPHEFLGLVGYALAEQIAPGFMVDPKVVSRQVATMMSAANSSDREPVIRFEPSRR